MILNRLIYLIGVSSIAVGLLFGCSNTANVGSDEIENYSAKQIYDRAEYEMARSKPIDAIAFFSDVEGFTLIQNGQKIGNYASFLQITRQSNIKRLGTQPKDILNIIQLTRILHMLNI